MKGEINKAKAFFDEHFSQLFKPSLAFEYIKGRRKRIDKSILLERNFISVFALSHNKYMSTTLEGVSGKAAKCFSSRVFHSKCMPPGANHVIPLSKKFQFHPTAPQRIMYVNGNLLHGRIKNETFSLVNQSLSFQNQRETLHKICREP